MVYVHLLAIGQSLTELLFASCIFQLHKTFFVKAQEAITSPPKQPWTVNCWYLAWWDIALKRFSSAF